jgi:hypothetical protein
MRREVVAIVHGPQDIEDEEALSFFGGSEGDADESQGHLGWHCGGDLNGLPDAVACEFPNESLKNI